MNSKRKENKEKDSALIEKTLYVPEHDDLLRFPLVVDVIELHKEALGNFLK